MKFSRQEYWSGLPFPSPGDLSNRGVEPGSLALQADSLLSKPQGRPEGIVLFFYLPPGQWHLDCLGFWFSVTEFYFDSFLIREQTLWFKFLWICWSYWNLFYGLRYGIWSVLAHVHMFHRHLRKKMYILLLLDQMFYICQLECVVCVQIFHVLTDFLSSNSTSFWKEVKVPNYDLYISIYPSIFVCFSFRLYQTCFMYCEALLLVHTHLESCVSLILLSFKNNLYIVDASPLLDFANISQIFSPSLKLFFSFS